MIKGSHDPSEIILICWFAAQETFHIVINGENSRAWYCFGNQETLKVGHVIFFFWPFFQNH